MVLPLNGFRSTSLILIYGWFLLAIGTYAGIIAGVIYISMEKKTPYTIEHANLPWLLSFTKL